MKRLKENGITLVALIITIIILLILAGITIGQLTGNGIFESAKQAKEKYENAQAEESEALNSLESQMNIASSRTESGNNSHYINYSDGEQEIGTWFGSTKLYQKTFTGEILSKDEYDENGSKVIGTIPTGAQVRDIHGIWYFNNGEEILYNAGMPFMSYANTAGKYVTTNFWDENIMITNPYKGKFAYVVTVQYTR